MSGAGFKFLPSPTPLAKVERVLGALAEGVTDVESLESDAVDIKEEAGRRDRAGSLVEGSRENEQAARQIADAAACMANTEGGGALIVGVDDRTGEIVGAQTDATWLRSRIYELTDRKLSADVHIVEVSGRRLVVVILGRALEPVPFNGRFRHRRGKNCVQVTASELIQGLLSASGADASSQRSEFGVEDLSGSAEAAVRRHLAPFELAVSRLPLSELLGRLGLTSDGTSSLNRAGEILLATSDSPSLDYMRKEVPGGPTVRRVNDAGLCLLEEIDRVIEVASAYVPAVDITLGATVRQVRAIPERSVREVILNGVCHREWADSGATVIEHVGHDLRVTSPGGFVRDVTAANIITHPSEPRYRTLMDAVRRLHLVEQEGVGVDRMVADLIVVGAPPPLIEETDRPAVRVVLAGRVVDERTFRFFAALRPGSGLEDVDLALLVYRARQSATSFLSAESCAPLVQRSVADAENAIERVARYQLASGAPVFIEMSTVAGSARAWKLSSAAEQALGVDRRRESTASALAWAVERGRISSSEYCELASVSGPTANTHLKALAAEGLLEPSSQIGRGRGFHYLPVTPVARAETL